MHIYELLAKNRRHNLIGPSWENLYVQERYDLLKVYPDFLTLRSDVEDFGLLQASIVIQAIENYYKIEELKKEKEKISYFHEQLKVFTFDGLAIYYPLFSVSTNLLFAKDQNLEFDFEHHVIDFFETYNFALYESSYTSLVLVGEDQTTRAYYHYDFHAVYIINNQGRLDVKICLFDTYLKKPNFSNILERLKPVITSYYAGDQKGFVRALYKGEFMSNKLYNRYLRFLKGRK